MVTLDSIRSEMKSRLADDKNRKAVEIRAATLDEALSDAAIQLEVSIHHVEYEILEKGFIGVFGAGKRMWVIKAYESFSSKRRENKKNAEVLFGSGAFEQEMLAENRDARFYIHYFGCGIFLKIDKALGNGHPILSQDIALSLPDSLANSLDTSFFEKYVTEGTDGEYISIGKYENNPAHDASLVVDVSDDEMTATITVTAPGENGSDISADDIKRYLNIQAISNGINENKANAFIDVPVYNEPYIVAEGVPPLAGRDAFIAYNFETDRTKIKLKETASGQVDFKELNLVQNVVEGQPLAQKMLAERGKAGKTVKGRYLEAKNGKDILLPLGNNVRVDDDGRTILASTNGQVLLINNKISVEPVLQIDGDVCLKTGNITFLGTVIISGSVEDSFSVKASGNIEIYGTVGKAAIEAEGDIVVSQGITGRGEAFIHAGKSLWAKFIENSRVDVEEFVIVSDGIINSTVYSNKKILVQGKRAAIIGGHLFATEEIHAKTIGSSGGGSETRLEVGYNPKSKKRFDVLTERQNELLKQLEEVELNIQTLENTKRLRKVLPTEKEESLVKLLDSQKGLKEEIQLISSELQEIQEYLRNLKIIGKVSVSDKVFAGVKIYIRDVKEDVRNDVKGVTFYLEDGFVRYGKYEGPSDDMKRSPDGYSTN